MKKIVLGASLLSAFCAVAMVSSCSSSGAKDAKKGCCNASSKAAHATGCCSSTQASLFAYDKEELEEVYASLSKSYVQMRKNVIRPAKGFLKYDYLVPAGFYSQLWDWDAFFMANHFISKGEPQHMEHWVKTFAGAVDKDGYVPGCIITTGPRPIFGKFAMKPFLSQGAYHYSKAVGDFTWLKPYYDNMKKVLAYRKQTQFDEKYGLYFWDNAMQSGADNNVAMNYFIEDKRSYVCADASAFQYGELLAQSAIAKAIGKTEDAAAFAKEAQELKANVNKYLWNEADKMYYNVNRKEGDQYKRPSYSCFIPLMYKMQGEANGKAMIANHLLSPEQFKAPYGFRTLTKQDPEYNNYNIIVPFSNWQGPVWPIASYIYSIALKNYGFEKEIGWMATSLGKLLNKDLETWGTMHENYHAETGAPLAPSQDHVDKDGKFVGFISWNLCMENVMEGVLFDKWMLLDIEGM